MFLSHQSGLVAVHGKGGVFFLPFSDTGKRNATSVQKYFTGQQYCFSWETQISLSFTSSNTFPFTSCLWVWTYLIEELLNYYAVIGITAGLSKNHWRASFKLKLWLQWSIGHTSMGRERAQSLAQNLGEQQVHRNISQGFRTFTEKKMFEFNYRVRRKESG